VPQKMNNVTSLKEFISSDSEKTLLGDRKSLLVQLTAKTPTLVIHCPELSRNVGTKLHMTSENAVENGSIVSMNMEHAHSPTSPMSDSEKEMDGSMLRLKGMLLALMKNGVIHFMELSKNAKSTKE